MVTKNGRPAAVLVNVHEYARLKETLEVLSDPALMKQISESRAFYRTGKKGLSFEDVFGEPRIPEGNAERRDPFSSRYPSARRRSHSLVSSRSEKEG